MIEKQDNYYMNFAVGLMSKITLSYYPQLMSFQLFNGDHFVCSKNDKIITGKGKSCNAYFIYIGYDTFMSNGFDEKGIHLLSIKNHNHEGSGQCIHSVGVISQRNMDYLYNDKYRLRSFPSCKSCIYTNHYNGYPDNWINGEIVTIKLDLDNFILTYFKNGNCQYKIEIPKEHKYFFAMHLCASDDSKMEIVDHRL